ncbi:hypothetical protein GCM10007898_31660 [Dyella flagellata]|uniref:Uncharacterized protein n=2 Tax=Dyella flagellata TaxID=1867833 RepID=A0ABQ5XD20_9GAMM|nr:hypothetical protein GCM10007898_31660 [Dyella flagellata]
MEGTALRDAVEAAAEKKIDAEQERRCSDAENKAERAAAEAAPTELQCCEARADMEEQGSDLHQRRSQFARYQRIDDDKDMDF